MGSKGSAQSREDLPLTGASVDYAALRARLADRQRLAFELPGLRRAAVLVPLFERAAETRTFFTLRSAALRNHSGQWSFPGGSTDADDANTMATAVREAEEEVGIDARTVDVLGLLGDVPTPTGYIITPVVGRIDPAPVSYTPNAVEVAEILEVALAAIGKPTEKGEIERYGKSFRMVAFDIEGRNVWGATARILDELLSVVAG